MTAEIFITLLALAWIVFIIWGSTLPEDRPL